MSCNRTKQKMFDNSIIKSGQLKIITEFVVVKKPEKKQECPICKTVLERGALTGTLHCPKCLEKTSKKQF